MEQGRLERQRAQISGLTVGKNFSLYKCNMGAGEEWWTVFRTNQGNYTRCRVGGGERE